MRVNDRTLPSGEKALHVEEWQSDWANELRRKNTPEVTVLYGDIEIGSFQNRQDADRYIRGQIEAAGNQTLARKYKTENKSPSHPLVDNWQDLMARRTLKEAVDGGYDRLTWTTGQQQADRYDLSKEIKSVRLHDNPSGGISEARLDGPFSGGTFTAWDLKGNKVIDDVRVNSEQELASYVGKEVAKKLLQEKVRNARYAGIGVRERSLNGLDLKVGGEWATKLYDESMVNRFNKMGKRYGVKVEDVPTHKQWKLKYGGILEDLDPQTTNTYKEAVEDFTINLQEIHGIQMDGKFFIHPETGERLTVDQMLKYAGTTIKQTSSKESMVHSIKITPEMKESIGKSRFHPFADLPGPAPKLALPAAPKLPDLHAQAAALDPSNPVRYAGDQMGYPLFQQEDPGVGSFIQRPGETVAAAFERAKAWYQK
jgi:hypothetical protein